MSELTGYLTSNGTDLSSIFLKGSSAVTHQFSGTFSGATSYTFQVTPPFFPGQVIFYTNGPTYSGCLIANMYWGSYSNTINTVFNVGNAFSSVTCFYNAGEFVTITMNAGVTQQITYNYKQM
jgi:hypothetical protein